MSDSDNLDSNTLSFRFTQKHSHSTLTLTQTNWIWLKLIHSDSTWWWKSARIWPSWIQPSCFFAQTHSHSRLVPNLFTKNFTHLSLNLMMAAILNSAMLDSDTAILDSNTLLSSLRFSKTFFLHSETDSNSFILTLSWCWQAILNSAILDSAILHKTLNQTSSIWLKLFHSHLTGNHLEFCHVGFKHCQLGQISCYLYSDSSQKLLSVYSLSDSN